MAENFGIGLRDWTAEDRSAIKSHWEERHHPRNYFLCDKIAGVGTASMLEIGSGCGNILYLLARKFPDARIEGVDLNPIAIECGNSWIRNEGIENVIIRQGDAGDLSRFPDKSFEVVFSCAALMYVPRREIQNALGNMVRIADKGLVMLEMHSDETRNYLGRIHPPSNWKRNYRKILNELGVADERITIEAVSNEIWQPGGGGAACIEVRLN